MRPLKLYGEDVLCLAVLGAMAVLAFGPVMTQDAVPVDTHAVFAYPPWQEARPAAFEPPSDAGILQAQRFFPWYAFLHDTVQRGDSLLWNPLEGCGIPFLSLWRNRCLSPFSVPFYVLPPATAYQLSVVLKLLVAGWTAYVLGRRMGLAPALGLLAAVAFQLSGSVYGFHAMPYSDVLVWLPLLVVFADRFVEGTTRHWPGAAIVLALMLLGGEPEAVAAAGVFGLIYVAIRLVLEREEPAAAEVCLVLMGLSGVLAVGLAAVQILPFVEFVGQTDQAGLTKLGPFPVLRDLVLWFFPKFFVDSGAYHHAPTWLYAGLAQILSVPLWVALRRFMPATKRRRYEPLLAAAAVLSVLPLLFPQWLSNAWPFRLFAGEHFFVGYALSLALMAAAAVDEWIELDADECRFTLVRLLVFLPVLVVAAAVLVFAQEDHLKPSFGAFTAQAALTAVWAVAFLGVLGVTLVRPSRRVAGYWLAVVTAFDLLLAFHAGVSYTPKREVLPQTAFVSALKATGGRIGGGATIASWPLAGNLVPQVYASSGIELERYGRFMQRLRDEPRLLARCGAPQWLLTGWDTRGDFMFLRPTLRVQAVLPQGGALFEYMDTNARAQVVHNWRSVEGPGLLPVDPEAPPLAEVTLPSPVGHIAPEPATISAASNDRVVVQVAPSQIGILVLADTWYPGWKAYINGEEEAVFPVDEMFRGVVVGPEARTVEFRYEPRPFRTGMGVTLMSAGLTVLFLLLPYLSRWRRR